MASPEPIELTVAADAGGTRLDRALADAAKAAGLALSRSRIAHLIVSGAVVDPDGRAITEAKHKVKPSDRFRLEIPAAADPVPQPEAIPLTIVHEDADLLVVDKPAGMVVHPAPGAETGTLVNALLAHCEGQLPGINGEKRPGIVHRIDKDTSGLLVVAKTEAALAGLSALFAAHDIQREYRAIMWGHPDRANPRLSTCSGVTFSDGWTRIQTLIGRDPRDRKRMAVDGGAPRNAISYLQVDEPFGPSGGAFASYARFRLETGRTHQIRVHAAHIGHALVGDPVYARPRQIARNAADPQLREALTKVNRQLLHAAILGFEHPVSRKFFTFRSELPPDFNGILTSLRTNQASFR